jgi:hypothetical protein
MEEHLDGRQVRNKSAYGGQVRINKERKFQKTDTSKGGEDLGCKKAGFVGRIYPCEIVKDTSHGLNGMIKNKCLFPLLL